jgi:hypothetical protein
MKDNIAFALQSLNTPGGHIVLFLGLVVVGVLAETFKLPKADDIIIGSLGGLFTALKTDYAKEK